MNNTVFAYRSRILHFIDNPIACGDEAWEYFEDGLLIVKNGFIQKVGPSEVLLKTLAHDTQLVHYPNHLLLPGFIDTHIHYPQTQMIAAYGEQLIEWLNNYTFPTEINFADKSHADAVSQIFLDELLRNGTTTALVFATVHPQSVDAFFEEAQRRKLRMICGKVLMDRNAPEALCDKLDHGYRESKALIERWHNVDRLRYAVTPRFAPTSSPEQLDKAGQLLREHEGLYLHTHLSESINEIEWVKKLFPEAEHYLEVYHQAGLLSRRSIFAHGIHLCDEECKLLAQHSSAVAHCPTSNLFLGSGLFNLNKMQESNIEIGLGTDVGAGTSFSMFKTMDEAYKIQQLRHHSLDPFTALYMATLGGARALDLENKIGSFKTNNEADFIVLDLFATPLLKCRTPLCSSLKDLLFVLSTLGDDRLVQKTFSMGHCVHDRDAE